MKLIQTLCEFCLKMSGKENQPKQHVQNGCWDKRICVILSKRNSCLFILNDQSTPLHPTWGWGEVPGNLSSYDDDDADLKLSSPVDWPLKPTNGHIWWTTFCRYECKKRIRQVKNYNFDKWTNKIVSLWSYSVKRVCVDIGSEWITLIQRQQAMDL